MKTESADSSLPRHSGDTTHGSLIWWTKTELTKLQPFACLCITVAIRSTPTIAMETIPNLSPLHLMLLQQPHCSKIENGQRTFHHNKSEPLSNTGTEKRHYASKDQYR